MSTYCVKSTVITNRNATPKTLTDAAISGGRVKAAYGYIQTYGAADGVGSIYKMFSIPSNARVDSVKMQAGALGTGATLDVGVYWPDFIPVGAGLSASVAGTVINTTLFASAVAASDALALTEVLTESAVMTIPVQEKMLWEAAGLASDPNIDLDVCVTVAGAVAAQGYIGLRALYAY
jgi:hypothetical protein